MAFLGLRGVKDFVTDEDPLSWRRGIMMNEPNGMVSLTGLTSLLDEEALQHYAYNWWTESLSPQGGALTGTFTDTGLSAAYTSGATAGTTLYVRMAEATAAQIRVGHQVLLRDADRLDVDVNAKVTVVVRNGSSSYIGAKLLEADDNGATTDLSDADYVMVVGNINADGGGMPDALITDPVKFTNFSQTFRTSLDLTRRAMLTDLRSENAYTRAKRRAMRDHMIEIEKAFWFSIKSENTGSNGKIETTTDGVIAMIKAGAPTNVSDYRVHATYAGQDWTEGGKTWLNTMLEIIARHGADRKMVFCGSGALQGIQELVETFGHMNLSPGATEWGYDVRTWITPFGTYLMKTHPLFSQHASTRYSMVITEPGNLRYRFLTDTTFIPQATGTGGDHERLDGKKEEFLTDCGLEMWHPENFGYLTGVGLNNIVS